MRKVILILLAVGLSGCATKEPEALSLYSSAPAPVAKGPDPLDKYLAWKKENHPNAEQRPRESYIAAHRGSLPESWVSPVRSSETTYSDGSSSFTSGGITTYSDGSSSFTTYR